MTRDKAMEIVKVEKMKHYNWYDDHDITSNEVGIRERANKWSVYSSDERANPISEKEFQSESEALENFIKRLRAINKLNSNVNAKCWQSSAYPPTFIEKDSSRWHIVH